MSFLNPVNEPVLRFKSTDAGAPQINYAARTAGDVKAVLKACLVTGYGDKASAGWSIVNEVNHVAEFVSPSVAMSDYRLGIDDTSASSTTWYYQFQDVRQAGLGGIVTKSTGAIDTAAPDGSWDLIVSQRGVLFVQSVKLKAINHIGSSLTYWGAVKSAVPAVIGKNMSWWCLGYNSPIGNEGRPSDFFGSGGGLGYNYDIEGVTAVAYSHPGLSALKYYVSNSNRPRLSYIDITADWYLESQADIIAQQPGLLLRVRDPNQPLPIKSEISINNRPCLMVWPTRGSPSNAMYITGSSNAICLIYLDYWEY